MGRLPLGKQPTFGDTLQELTWPLVNQSPSSSCLSVGIGDWMPFRQSDADQGEDGGIWKPL